MICGFIVTEVSATWPLRETKVLLKTDNAKWGDRCITRTFEGIGMNTELGDKIRVGVTKEELKYLKTGILIEKFEGLER